ncbi:hypothetical protein B0H14DRAFT_3856391 [Mycena olivaceomarginata]|nr:hypothetical protein B0H14DRAFT_3856391 [Mycena olivaceomarginata]
MVHQWHYRRRLLPPPPTARRRLSWVRLVPPNNDLLATAQPHPTSRRHPGSPFTAALAVQPSFKLGSPERAAKSEEDPYLVNIASTRRLATLPRLITLPRARRQDVKDRQGCYLLAALATFGIAFASAIAGHLPYLRRPSAARPPPSSTADSSCPSVIATAAASIAIVRSPSGAAANAWCCMSAAGSLPPRGPFQQRVACRSQLCGRMVEASLKETESRGESTRIRLDVVLLEIDHCEMEIQTRLGWHGWWDAALHLGEERNCFLNVPNLASLVESSGQIECPIVEADKMTGRSVEGWCFTKRAIRYTAASAAFVVPLGRLQNTSRAESPPHNDCIAQSSRGGVVSRKDAAGRLLGGHKAQALSTQDTAHKPCPCPADAYRCTGDTGAAPHRPPPPTPPPPPSYCGNSPLPAPPPPPPPRFVLIFSSHGGLKYTETSEAQSFPPPPAPPAPPPWMSAPPPPRASLGDTPPPPSPPSPNPMLNDKLRPIAAKKSSAPVPIQSQSPTPSSPFDLERGTAQTPLTKKKTKQNNKPRALTIRSAALKNKSVRPALNSTIYSGHSGGTLSLSLSATLATPTPKICV